MTRWCAALMLLTLLVAGCAGTPGNTISSRINGRLDNISAAVATQNWAAFESQLGSATTSGWQQNWVVIYEDGSQDFGTFFTSPAQVAAFVRDSLRAARMEFHQRKEFIFQTESSIDGRMVMEDEDGNMRDAAFRAFFLRPDWYLINLQLRFNE